MRAGNPPKINFDICLSRGHASYNRKVGAWWFGQSRNGAHKRAYKNIAGYLRERLEQKGLKPGTIIDYACGDGSLICQLLKEFPRATFVGLDGSDIMLAMAEHKLRKSGIDAERLGPSVCFHRKGPRVRLVKTVLPNFSLPGGRADAALYIFPNLTCSHRERARYEKHGYKNKKDAGVAGMLARFREMDPEEEMEAVDPGECYDDLMLAKVVSRNLRRLLKKGGYLIRLDYANAPREQLSDLIQWRTLFTEGALDVPIKGRNSERIFRLLESRYWRSSVIQDVYHQSGSSLDKKGGYFCSMFKSV